MVSASLTKHKPSALGSGCYAGGIVGKRTSYNQITSCENTGTFQVNATDYSGENSISSGSGDIAGNTN